MSSGANGTLKLECFDAWRHIKNHKMFDDLNYMHKDGFQLTSLDNIIISEKLYRERCISFMC